MTHVDRDAFTILSLCAGVGGLDLGLALAVPSARTVCYVEREGACVETLASRMEDGTLDAAPMWADLTDFDGTAWRGVVDCIVGGYPCQPFSVAGRRRGARDDRHLWPHVKRIVGEVEPAWCFFENVGHHLRLGGRAVVTDLLALGYTVAVGLFTAEEVGAPHKRERLFIVAHRRSAERGTTTERRDDEDGRDPRREETASSTRVSRNGMADTTEQPQRESRDAGLRTERRARVKRDDRKLADASIRGQRANGRASGNRRHVDEQIAPVEDPPRPRHRRTWDAERGRWRVRQTGDAVVHAHGTRSQGRDEPLVIDPDQRPAWPPGPEDRRAWRRVLRQSPGLEPAVRRVADGIPGRVDRLRACGNSVVPVVAAYAFLTLAADVLTVGDALT